MKRSKVIEHLKKPEKKMQSQTRRLQELSFQSGTTVSASILKMLNEYL